MSELKFTECNLCNSIPGSPPLCNPCRINRAIAEERDRAVAFLKEYFCVEDGGDVLKFWVSDVIEFLKETCGNKPAAGEGGGE